MWQLPCWPHAGEFQTAQSFAGGKATYEVPIRLVNECIGDFALVEIEHLLDSIDSRKARLVVIHPLTRTDKAGLLDSRQQSGSYLTALLRVRPRFPSRRRPYSVDETGGVPLSMKV
jgi:hypothetical protein